MRFTQCCVRVVAWLLLTFLICLHNQLSSVHSTVRIKEYRCLKNVIHQIDSKNELAALFSKFYDKICIGSCLNTVKRFFLEMLFSSKQKEHSFF